MKTKHGMYSAWLVQISPFERRNMVISTRFLLGQLAGCTFPKYLQDFSSENVQLIEGLEAMQSYKNA